MATVRQRSFSTGEISPSLRGRDDVPRYASALRKAKNVIITPHGTAPNRPGTRYVVEVKDSTKRVRLVPFIFSDTDAVLLEFGHNYIRFIKNREQVMSGLTPYELVTTYTEAELPYLKFAQVGDVLTITHGAHAAAELRRTTDTSWVLTSATLVPFGPWFPNLPKVDASSVGTPDATHPSREWVWKITNILRETATGAISESTPHTVANITSGSMPAGNLFAVYRDMPLTLLWTTGTWTPSTSGDLYQTLGWRVYRGRGTVFGFIGDASPTATKFVDVGDAEDLTIQPPTGRNPFEVYNNANTLIRTELPRVVGFHQQRMVFAGTTQRPWWLWFSRIGDYSNFDVHRPPMEDDGVDLEIASFRREDIRSLVSMDRLFAFTSGGVWTLEDIVVGQVPQIRKQTDEGATWLSPLVVGDSILYVREKGVGVNEFLFDDTKAKFKTSDVTALSRHLFENNEITDWTYAHDPHRIIWAVRADGKFLSLAFHKDMEVTAWCWHETDGEVESVCAIPDVTGGVAGGEAGTEDAVYFVVKRTIDGVANRYIERLSTRHIAHPEDGEQAEWEGGVDDALFLDCAKVFSGAASNAVTGLEHLEGESVMAVADGNVVGPFTVDGGEIDLGLPDGASEVQVGLSYVSDWELLDIPAGRAELKDRQKNVKAVVLDVENSRGGYIGEDFQHLSEWRQRVVSSSYDPIPLYTGEVSMAIRSSWNTGGRAAIRQTDPLPLCIAGVSRKVVLSDE